MIKLPIPNGGAIEKDSWQYYLHALAPLPVNSGTRIKALIMDAIKVRRPPYTTPTQPLHNPYTTST